MFAIRRLSAIALAAALVATPGAAQDKKGPAPKDPNADLLPKAGDVVAKVGKVALTGKDLFKEMNKLIPMTFFHQKVPRGKMIQFRNSALKKLIESVLIALDGTDRGIEVEERELQAAFKRMLAKNPRQAMGLTDKQKKDMRKAYSFILHRDLVVEKNILRFRKTIPKVDVDKLRKQFEAKEHSIKAPRAGHFQHLFIRLQPTDSVKKVRKAKRTILAAQMLIREGTPFAEVARKYSQDEWAKKGGDMGVRPRSFFKSKTLADAAFKLKDGELSPVIQTIYGYHLVRCVKWEPPRPLTFDEIKDQLVAKHQVKEEDKAFKAWMDEIKKRHPVKILLSKDKPQVGTPAPGKPGGESKPTPKKSSPAPSQESPSPGTGGTGGK